MAAPAKYLTNRNFLAAIHESKKSYCWYESPKYSDYHVIVSDLKQVTPGLIAERQFELANPKAKVPAQIVADSDFVVRLMTFDHIPLSDDGKRRRGEAHGKAETMFPPYKHYTKRNGTWVEVGRSHWKGDLESGCYSNEHGRITNQLAQMYVLLVERYSRRPNWRGYSYVDEMRSGALVSLMQVGLKFNEMKSDNPFAFYSTTIQNCFVRTLNNEHRHRDIKDEILMRCGKLPSFARQMSEDFGPKP